MPMSGSTIQLHPRQLPLVSITGSGLSIFGSMPNWGLQVDQTFGFTWSSVHNFNAGISASGNLYLTPAGSVNIGNGLSGDTTSGCNILQLNHRVTDVSQNVQGIFSTLDMNALSDSSKNYHSAYNLLSVPSINANNLTGILYGVRSQVEIYGSGSVSNAKSIYGFVYNAGSGNILTAIAGQFGISNNTSTSGIIGTATSVYISSTTKSSGSINLNRGLFIDNQTVGVTNYSIYTKSGSVRFGDNVNITLTSASQLRLSYTDNSVYSDFGVGTGGDLTIAPTGNFVFAPTGNNILPIMPYDINIGAINKKYLSLFASELWVESLVSQQTIATIGGRILVGRTNVLTSDTGSASGSVTIYTKYNNINLNDIIYLESSGKVEFMQSLTSASSAGSGSPYAYLTYRDLDGSGPNYWYAGDAVFNTGSPGNGFIDLYSLTGIKGAFGPTIVGNVRNTYTYNDWTERWAIGNLNGVYGYGSDTYGVAFGQYTANIPHLTIDSSSGIAIYNGIANLIGQWDTSGNIVVGNPSSDNVYITSGHVQMRYGTTVYSDLASGSFTIGQVASGQSNVFITSGSISIRNNTTDRVILTSDGNLSINNVSGSPIIKFDSSGVSSITGSLTMPTTNSAFSIGATPPSGSSTGTGIWIDRTGLYSMSNNVVQVNIDTTSGSLYAGNGNVSLGVNGIQVAASNNYVPSSQYVPQNSYSFTTNGSVVSNIFAYNTGGSNMLFMRTWPVNLSYSSISVQSWTTTGCRAHADFYCSAGVSSTYRTMGLYVDAITGGSACASIVGGGLYVGGSSLGDNWPTDGNIIASNNIYASGCISTVNSNVQGYHILARGFNEVGTMATPSTPASGFHRHYGKSDGFMYYLNDSGVERGLGVEGTWNPSYTGFTTPTPSGTFTYILVGKLCIAFVYMSSSGSSNATTMTCTAPFTSANNGITQGGANLFAYDNGAALTGASKWQINPNSNVINFYSNMYNGGWTATGTKRASCIAIFQTA